MTEIEIVLKKCQESLQKKGLMLENYEERLEQEINGLRLWLEHKGKNKALELLNAVNENVCNRENKSNSLIVYLLGISDLDPIANDLETKNTTFIQGDPPDIDTDFHPAIRDRVKDRIVEMFGEEKTCSIGTYGTYKTRAVIIDVARALGYDVQEAMMVTKEMDPLKSFETEDGDETIVDKMDFDEIGRHYPELREYLSKHPDIIIHADIIRNQVRNMGKHAGGVIISDMNLQGKIPILRDKSGKIISAWAESGGTAELSQVGLVKYDLLSINNLPVIADCVKLIEEERGIKIKRSSIPLDDRKTIRLESKGDLKGIFQFENPGTKAIVDQVGMESLADVSAITSLLRPGPKDMGMHLVYGERKNGKDYEIIPCLENIFRDTYGVLVYQEQMMLISKELCGFSGPEANRLRKACITIDSEFISKSRGPITLERMLKEGYKGDFFLQRDNRGRLGWSPIIDIWKSGKKRVRRTISSSGYFVDATRLHQFLTDDGWKAQQRLETGDRLVCARMLEWEGCDAVSRDFAIIIAGLLTEGFTPKDKYYATFTSFDKEFMNIFVESFEKEFSTDSGSLSPDGKVYRIKQSACKKIFKIMSRGLSGEKYIPNEIMSLTKDTMKDVISFMLGAEGGICQNNGTFEFTSKSKKMIHQVRTMLLRFGIRSLFNTKNVPQYGVFYRLNVNEIIDQEKLLSLSHLWPDVKRDDLEKRLKMKSLTNYTSDTIPQRVVKKMMNQYPNLTNGESGSLYIKDISRNRFSRIANNTKDREWIDLAESDFWLDKYLDSDEVVSPHTDVYDFEVFGEPNMIVNGMVIHNCGKKKLDLMKSIRQQFIDGAGPKIASGEVTLEQVEEMWSLIASFAAYGFNKCLTLDTVVETPDGAKCLGEIEIGDFVMGEDRNMVEVIDTIDTGRQEVFEVVLESGAKIKCTSNHKFKCGDGVVRPIWEIVMFGYEIEVSGNCEMTSSKVKYVRSVGERNTKEITVDSESHLYVANGMITSNSHAVTYSMITTAELWLKHHYFPEYMTSLLLNTKSGKKKHGSNVLVDYINYTRKRGVKVLPPSVNSTKPDFHINNHCIVYGLAHVRNVSATAEHISAIASQRQFENMADFYERCVYEKEVKSGINSGNLRITRPSKQVVESLIYAGAFDSFGDRNTMLREYYLSSVDVPSPTDAELEEEQKRVLPAGMEIPNINDPNAELNKIKGVGNVAEPIRTFVEIEPFKSMADFYERCVFETVVKSGKNKGTTKTTRPTKKAVESLIYAGAFDSFGDRRKMLKEYYATVKNIPTFNISKEELIEKEKEVLGLSLSEKPLFETYEHLINKHNWTTIGNHKSLKKPVVFGRIENIESRNAKSGNPMFVVTMSDGMDELTFYVWMSAMEQFRDIVKKRMIVAIPMSKFEDGYTRFFDDRRTIQIINEKGEVIDGQY
jgi:DNA polymerase III alpha subunit/intein/homing endonuclease